MKPGPATTGKGPGWAGNGPRRCFRVYPGPDIAHRGVKRGKTPSNGFSGVRPGSVRGKGPETAGNGSERRFVPRRGADIPQGRANTGKGPFRRLEGVSLTIVGQAPNRHGLSDPDEVLTGRSGRKIAEIAGLSFDDFLFIRRVNLNKRWNGKAGKGDRFMMSEGRASAQRLLDEDHGGGMVLLGRSVAKCFGLEKCEPLTTVLAYGRRFFIMPHPSGVNRWWNDPKNVKAAKRSLRRFINAR